MSNQDDHGLERNTLYWWTAGRKNGEGEWSWGIDSNEKFDPAVIEVREPLVTVSAIEPTDEKPDDVMSRLPSRTEAIGAKTDENDSKVVSEVWSLRYRFIILQSTSSGSVEKYLRITRPRKSRDFSFIDSVQ